MISLKFNSQPFQPSEKSKHFQKKIETIQNSNGNESKNEFGKKDKREIKEVKMTIVYCSNYLKMLKDYNKELPDGCTQEQLDYIKLTQQQSSSSLQSIKSIKTINSNNSKRMKRNYTKRNYYNKQKKDQTSSLPNHALFTTQKKSQEIEILIPTTKPIALHHPSLIKTSFNSNNNLKEIDEFPNELNEEINEKRKQSREKQISFGKNTNEYQNYISIIPKEERRKTDPKTPDIEISLSKRKWDKLVRKWRRSLHAFDNVNHKNQIELARALAFRLQNEENPKKNYLVYSSYLVDE